MPSPSYTYTLTNGTSADADQVMQNFDDILNGITDGTKDLSIAALTVAGTATFNGNVTLGNASSDDLTFTGSLASSIPIKTDATYDIGTSSIGLRTAYFGGNSNRVGIKASASTSATYDITLPTTAGTSGYLLQTDGSGVLSYFTQDASTFSATLNTGMNTSSTNITVTYKLIGGTVHLMFPNTEVTAGATTASWSTSGTPVPSALRPSATKRMPVALRDQGNIVLGVCIIATTGSITFQNITGTWTASDTNCGIDTSTVTYNV